jgi:hypothetical protein
MGWMTAVLRRQARRGLLARLRRLTMPLSHASIHAQPAASWRERPCQVERSCHKPGAGRLPHLFPKLWGGGRAPEGGWGSGAWHPFPRSKERRTASQHATAGSLPKPSACFETTLADQSAYSHEEFRWRAASPLPLVRSRRPSPISESQKSGRRPGQTCDAEIAKANVAPAPLRGLTNEHAAMLAQQGQHQR